MDPLSIGLLAASSAIQAGGNIAAGAQTFNRDDRERLRELERQQALGELGLSPQERAIAQRQIVQTLQVAERQAASERASQMAAQDLGQGAAYRQMLLQEQVRQQSRLAAQQMLQQRQEAAVARDLAEMQQLEEQRRQRRQMMIGGGTQALAQGAQLGAQINEAQIARDQQLQLEQRQLDIVEALGKNQPPPLYVYPTYGGSFMGEPQ